MVSYAGQLYTKQDYHNNKMVDCEKNNPKTHGALRGFKVASFLAGTEHADSGVLSRFYQAVESGLTAAQSGTTLEKLHPEATLESQCMAVVVEAVRLLFLNEIMPEDLMSAVLDILPPGSIFDNPLRAKLIQAQDYLEERQTLVNNAEASDLNIDILEIDYRNARRCGSGHNLEEAIAAAFYAFTARKHNFRDVVEIALRAGNPAISAPVAAALAGATIGLDSVPAEWLEQAGFGKKE
jgi:hypothetical protein